MDDRRKYVKGRAFNTMEGPFNYPERQCDQYTGKLEAGVCFSGGGTRAATLAAGQLRALRLTGALDRFGYLSCVSGGSWSAVPYTFLDPGITDDEFLGPYIPPEQMTHALLADAPERSLTYAACHAAFLDDLPGTLFSGDERYAELIGTTFLKPYNIASERRFFSLDNTTVARILKHNPRLNRSDFYTVNTSEYRPFLIANGTILRPGFKRYHFEMTPLYVGTSTLHQGAGSDGQYDIGGGYVEPHMFDADSPSRTFQDGRVRVRLGRERHMFTLSDMIGTSGAAPAEYADRYLLEVGFPEFKYWCPNNPGRAKEYDFGDGGILENLGIMPLLKRGLKRLIVFVNCESNLFRKEIPSSITALFKSLPDRYGSGRFRDNIVLEDNGRYRQLVDGLQQSAAGGNGAVYTGEYRVLDQPHYGVIGGDHVRITWVVNARAQNWADRLPFEVKKRLDSGEYGKHFPHLATFFENFPAIIDLGTAQANLMAHHASWVVKENEAAFTL